MHSSSVLAGILYQDILSICFGVCPFKMFNFIANFFPEGMICQDKYLVCCSAH